MRIRNQRVLPNSSSLADWVKALVSHAGFWVALGLLPSSMALAAQTIQFPEDELAKESVLPIFDQPVSVKNRTVNTAQRLEIGPMFGYSLSEPFFNPISIGVTASYHFNEESAFNLYFDYFLGGLADNGKKLNPIPGSGPPPFNANLQYAPQSKYLLLANYQFTAFYGKISLTKDYVMNLGLYGMAGVGGLGIGDSTVPVFNVGLGQKFYFTRSIALRFDLRLLIYDAPNPVSAPLSNATSEPPNSYFQNKLYTSGLLSGGFVFLLP